MRRCLPLLLLVAGCGAGAAAPAAAPRPAPTRAVAPAARAQAAVLARSACAAWAAQGRATDLPSVQRLRTTAEHDASAAGRLDPRWAPLAGDLLRLRELERAYAAADVHEAYALRPRLEALRAGVPGRC